LRATNNKLTIQNSEYSLELQKLRENKQLLNEIVVQRSATIEKLKIEIYQGDNQINELKIHNNELVGLFNEKNAKITL